MVTAELLQPLKEEFECLAAVASLVALFAWISNQIVWYALPIVLIGGLLGWASLAPYNCATMVSWARNNLWR